MALQYVRNQTPEICSEALKLSGWALKYVKEKTYELCLEAVKQNGDALEYVKEQTYELCLEAVKNYPPALNYVKEQTTEMCLEAIKNLPFTLVYVKEQTEELCLEAVKRDGMALEYVKDKTPKICFYALINEWDVLSCYCNYEDIEKYIKNNNIKDKIFCDKTINKLKNADFYFDNISLENLRTYLFQENSNNKYVLDDNTDIGILKEIALSNNELILVDRGNIKDIHRILANKIVAPKDLEKELF